MVRHKYSAEEIQFLKDNVKGTPKKELTEMFNNHFGTNISIKAISNQLNKYNLKIGINTGCFKKGHASHNKGKKWDDYMNKESQERCRKTCFQKGKNINNNWWKYAEVGSETLDKCGYIYVRTSERVGNKSHQFWKAKHHLVYEQYHGKVPKGHKVIFADGNNRNFDIDNLILVTNAELLKMNSEGLYYKGYAELTKTGHLIAKLDIKTKEKENG